jgi:hypothetical protein
MNYYCRTVAGVWEEVTWHVFQLRHDVLNEDNTPRYEDSFILVDGGEITIKGIFAAQELPKIMRFLGISAYTGNQGPLVVQPETLKIKKGRRIVLHLVRSGEDFIPKAGKKPKVPSEVPNEIHPLPGRPTQ